MALYVVSNVSLSLPHVLPASDFSTLLRDRNRLRTWLAWAENVIMLSKMTPSILGVFDSWDSASGDGYVQFLSDVSRPRREKCGSQFFG
jgi:hypothetical protein